VSWSMLTKRTDISSIRGYAPNYSVNLISKSDRLLAGQNGWKHRFDPLSAATTISATGNKS
jgi:hypothetical protein